MGDVIMVLPVIRAFTTTYPDEEVILVTKKPFDLFFNGIPGVSVVIARHHDEHKGFAGLLRLFREIRKEHNISAVIDLHDVLRSKVMRTLFMLTGCRTAKIRKGRWKKWQLTKGRIRRPLRHTVERYADTFRRAGFPLKMTAGPWLYPSAEALLNVATLLPAGDTRLIGVAPLAKHELKMWPAEKMISFLNKLTTSLNVTIYLFGSPDESPLLEKFAEKVPGCIIIAGRIRLAEEMALISKLDLMIAMDSSNMHLANMLGVKTVSIWGATHPWAGFSAWGSDPENAVQVLKEELDCRPCTVYGKGTCRRGDLACLNRLDPSTLLNKVLTLLNEE